VTVDYYTSTGHTSDIIAAAGTLRFAPGETSKTITVQVVGDLIPEDLKAFNVYLHNQSPNASLGNSAGYCYIEDNDPLPAVSIGDVSKSEGNSGNTTFSFVVTLTAPAGDSVFVEYATSDGTATTENQDYAAKSGYVYFDPGQTTQTINVTVKGDTTKEADETFYVDLLYAGGATIADDRGVGTILNDDGATSPGSPPTIDISDAEVVEGNSGTRLMTFTVTLSHASSQEVRVSYGTQNGTARTSDSDYVSTSGTLKFAPGQTTKTITVKVKGDKKVEADETFLVHLSGARNGVLGDSEGVGTIFNDDGLSSRSSKSTATYAAAVDAALYEMFVGRGKSRRK
jgi:urease beta subunit